MPKPPYDVYGYQSQQHYDRCEFSVVETNLCHIKDARSIAQQSLTEYPITKVKTSDGENDETYSRESSVAAA